MNSDPDPELDDEFTAHLLAFEEALATGMAPTDLADNAPPELRTRLLRNLACVQRLQQLRPQSRSPGAHETGEFPARIGRFEIRCPLGRGGFGIVYRAYDPVLRREVALKIPRADALVDTECRARFEREAHAAAGLDHPNLVPVHEAGQLGPICYIAFAFCPGHDLATWLKGRTAPVRCIEAARLVRILARALHYAHECGILHRDLKPSNVLLSPATTPSQDSVWLPEADCPLIPRVTDFGLAKFAATDQSQTQTGNLLGTPNYMAPEQTEGRPVGPTTDVYALGIILYELVAGRPPFWADTAVATLLRVKTTEPVPPSRLRPELPHDLETICLKCLHKEPRKRYASAAALANDLDRFLSGRPIEARPSSRAEQALKWARRHPALTASLGALLLVTILGTVGILGQWHETQSALAQALTQKEHAQKAQQAEARERESSEVALYHHRVVLAHHEWQNGNGARATQLLGECRIDLRNWEWRYVRRLCDSAVFTAKHSAPVLNVAFSADGRYLASAAGQWFAGDPGEVKVWDAATGKPLWTGLGHAGPMMSVAFSPDGRRLASGTGPWGCKTGEAKIWDTTTGKPLTTLSGMPPGIFGVAFSPQGDRLATAGADSKVRLWDVESGQQLFVLDGHKSNVFSVAFSPDGSQLASAGWAGDAIIWDLASRRALRRLRGPNDLRSVEFSRDGRCLLAASFDESVKIWDAATGRLLRTFWGHRGPALCATFAPDGRHIASTDSLGTVHIWDAQTGRIVRTVRGHTRGVFWAAYNPNGRLLATAGRDGTMRVWDITRDQSSQSLPQAAGAQSAVFSPNGRLLAASGYTYSSGKLEKRVRVWALDNWAGPHCWQGHTGWVRCVAFNADGKLLASGGTDRTVRLWDVAMERSLHVLEGHTDIVTSVAFNCDGTRLASASLDKTVQLWDLGMRDEGRGARGEGKEESRGAGDKGRGTKGEKEAAPLLAPRPSPVANLLAPLLAPRPAPLTPLLALTHPYPVHDVAFAPDGKRLVAVGNSGMVLVWDAVTATQLFALPGHRNIVARAVFSLDGRRLATAGEDKTIRIWDMTTNPLNGQPATPLHVLTGHTDRINGLCFSSDGRRLASTGPDQTIRIWDGTSGDESLTLRGHTDSPWGVAFSPDGRLLVSASGRDIKIWDAE